MISLVTKGISYWVIDLVLSYLTDNNVPFGMFQLLKLLNIDFYGLKVQNPDHLAIDI